MPDTPPAGTLTLVSTPIGNLGDMTPRAVEALRQADLVLAEDTRHSRKLLAHFGLSARPEPYHDHNKERVTPKVVEMLLAGRCVALVTDAGTPGISDPGFYLVRAAIAAGVRVTAAPGANAILPALVLSGFPTDAFVFEGFTPRKKGELARAVAALEEEKRTVLFFVSPHQLLKVLAAFAARLPERPLAVARELTKMHEEVARGTAAELVAHFERTGVRGEMVLVVHGAARKRKGAAA
ncbi:MAG: 16S rRNA (cytidine(1402)-2'-O)-methyltransferase [Candidatus Krumholzibacteria bacterium]|nr:16S rRNA (cytidine(1402)-2'-O)-methyltransferase [Candidatus Krumholzibacteria bacterium]